MGVAESSVDPHRALRDDVRLLGELLGETLRRQEGQALFERVERVRALAKRTRVSSSDGFEALAGELRAMPVESALPIARSFAHFLNLANVAEQHHRVRRRRAYQRDPRARPSPPRSRRPCRGCCRAGSRPTRCTAPSAASASSSW